MANALKTKKELVQELEEAQTRLSEVERLKEVLRASEEKFTRIFSHNPLALSISRVRDGVIIEINESYTRLAGYKREEIIGRRASEMNIWVNLPDRERMLKSLKDKGQIISEEYHFRSKSGEVHPVLLSAENINIGGEDCLLIMTIDISRRVSAEEELRESEEFTSSLLTNTPNPIMVITPDTAIKYVNPAFEKLTGFALTDIIGMKPPYPLWHQESRKEMDAILKQAAFEDVIKMEMAYQKKSGEHFCVELNATSIKKDGEQKYALVNWVDITERKKTEKALRESEQKYSGLVEHGNDGILIIQDHVIKYINSKLLDIFGYSYEEVIGKQFISVLSEEHKERVISRSRKRLAGEVVPEKYEIDIIKKNGEKVNVEVNASLMEFEGRPADMAIVRDMTERKKVEEALKESEEKYARVFNSSPVGFSLARLKDNVIIEVNDSYIHFTGYPREEIVGHKASELNIWANLEDRLRMLKILKDEGRVSNQEVNFRVKSGAIHTVLVSAENIYINGEDCLLVMATDITGRKRAEEALRFSDAAFKSIHESVIAVDNENIITYWNNMSERLFGVKSSEAIGKNLFNIIRLTEKRPGHAQELFQKLQDQGYNRDELLYTTPQGQIWIDMTIQVIAKDNQRHGYVITALDITERKKAEEALKDSEEKFSKAFNSSANAVCIVSLSDNKFVEVNESYCRFTGYSREEVIGRTAADLNLWVYQEDLKKLQSSIEKEGKFTNFEFHSRMKSGEIRIGLSSAEVMNIAGKPCRIIVITDITERKKADEALKESEEKFAKAFSASANAIGITSLKTNLFIDANESFTRFTGYSREELIGHNAREFNLWVKPEELKKWGVTLQAEGRAYNQEISSRMKSGEIRVGLYSAEKINIGGEPCRITAITDITKRKKAEEALRESEEKFSKAFSASAIAICITSLKDARIIDVNASFMRFTGYSREELIGHTATELSLWGDLLDPKLMQMLLEKNGVFSNLEFISHTKSGETRAALTFI